MTAAREAVPGPEPAAGRVRARDAVPAPDRAAAAAADVPAGSSSAAASRPLPGSRHDVGSVGIHRPATDEAAEEAAAREVARGNRAPARPAGSRYTTAPPTGSDGRPLPPAVRVQQEAVPASRADQRAGRSLPPAVRVQHEAAPASRADWGPGRSLPPAVRAPYEAALGADLSAVRIHSGSAAARAARAAGAAAMTWGRSVAFAGGAYRPETARGRHVLAHELAHVVQQQHGPARLRRLGAAEEEAGAPAADEAPVYLSVGTSGLTLTSPGRELAPGPSGFRQALAVLLRRLVPSYHPGLEDEVAAALPSAEEIGGWGLFAEDRPIEVPEPFPTVILPADGYRALVDTLGQLGITELALTDEQRRLLLLAGLSLDWGRVEVPRLQAEFPWYTGSLWDAQVAMHGAVFDRAVQAQQAAQAGDGAAGGSAATGDTATSEPATGQPATSEMATGEPAGGAATGGEGAGTAAQAERDAFVALIRAPLLLLEAIRTDVALATEKASQAAYQVVWGLPKDGAAPAALASEEFAVSMIEYHAKQPELAGQALTDHGARVEFLRRYASWIGRTIERARTPGDFTQGLEEGPSRWTDPPFPASLVSFPPPAGAARALPAQVDHRFLFSVRFPDALSAMGQYTYVWDLIRWAPPSAGAQAAALTEEDRAPVMAATPDATSTPLDLARARYQRDLLDAAEDIGTLTDTFGPPGVTVGSAYLGVLMLREAGTTAQLAIDLVTLSSGPGLREHAVQFPEPGIWIVRVAAVPVVDDGVEIVRPPSVAYVSAYAVAQEEFAELQLSEAEGAQATAEKGRAELTATLEDVLTEETDPALREQLQTLLDETEMEADRWVGVELLRDRTADRLAQITEDIAAMEQAPPAAGADAAAAAEQLSVLRAERDRLAAAFERLTDDLDVRAARIEDQPALGGSQPLPVGFAADDGRSVQLTADWVQIAREDADLTQQMAAPDGSVFVLISDHTTPNSGIAQGYGGTVGDAVVAALRNLLQGQTGYGRGIASVRLPDGSAESVRIAASAGTLFTEALHDLSTVLTVAAIVAAPFTEGASLAILVPVGVVAGLEAGYRMYSRSEAHTLRWDEQTAMDIVDMVGAVMAAGSASKLVRGGLEASRMARAVVVGLEIAQDTTGLIVMGGSLVTQLEDIDSDEKLSDGERRARRFVAVGTAMMQAGMMVGQSLVHRGTSDLQELRRRQLEELQTGTRRPPGQESVPGLEQQTGEQQPATVRPDEQPAPAGDQQPAVPEEQQPAAVVSGEQQPAAAVPEEQPAPAGDQQPAVPGEPQPAAAVGEQQPAGPQPGEQQPAVAVPEEQQPAAAVPDEQSAVPQPDEQQPAAAVSEQQPAAPVPGEQPAVVVPEEPQPAVGQPGEQPLQGSSGESASVPAAPTPQAPTAAASAVRTDLAARRADVAGRFADSDREWQQAGGTGSAPSVRFDEAMTALGEAGLTPPARAAIDQLFAPRRGSRISRADFDAAVARVQSVADLLAARPDALTEPSLATRRRGIEEAAGAVVAAHADGMTLQGVPLSNAQARELTTEVERMTQAVQRFAAAPPADPVARLLALEGLRETVARASEVLRSYGPRFEVETGVDELPGRPRAGQPEQARHTRSRQIAERLATADVAAMPVQELLAAMEFSTLEVTATGTVGEPLSRSLPGMGLEQYTLTPDQVRVLKTVPPGLAARIADLLAGYQRSHLIGPGMGDEVFAGLMLAPEGVNQVAQNRGVETFIRSVAEGGVEVELEATAYGRRLAIPLADGGFEYVDVLTGVDYTIDLTHERGSTRHQVLLDIADPPNGAWRAVHNDVPADAPGGDVLAAGG